MTSRIFFSYFIWVNLCALLVLSNVFSLRAEVNPPSVFGVLTSARWGYGQTFKRQNLQPVANPNGHAEKQPVREHPYDIVVSKNGEKIYISLLGSELADTCLAFCPKLSFRSQ